MHEPRVVAFVQPYVPSYRRGLFDAISERLEERGFKLEVWHAAPTGRVAARANSIVGPWSRAIPQYRATMRGKNVTYRPIAFRARAAEAVIAGLASTNLETYQMALDPHVNLMLWGHGRNFTARRSALDARLEAWLGRRASHVFAYTERGREHLLSTGMSSQKVSTVRNTTDVVRLRAAQAGATDEYLTTKRRDLELLDTQVGLFVGALDEPKRFPFLLAAADLIHARNPSFRLLIAGAGPLQAYVAEEAASRPFVTLLGRLEIDDLGALSNLVDVILMPGRVGLVAVDALALGVPLVTTDYPFHAPEAEYLSAASSITTANDTKSYADGVVKLLQSPERIKDLQRAATAEGALFSTGHSADIFVDVILRGMDRR